MNRFSPLPARHRFSLAWRVTALSSLLLLILVALFIWLGHHHLTQQFENSRMAHHERQQREIRLAMQRSADNLRQLAGLTASVSTLGDALALGDTTAIDNALRSQWPSLQLEAGVDEVFVFDPQGRLLGHSGGIQGATELPVEGWIEDVLAREAPITTLRCGLNCQQYAAVPILVEGRSMGMVVLSRSLADVTREAKEVSRSEIALMVTGYTGSNNLDASRRLSEWNGHLVALTSREATLPLLERASNTAPIFELADRPLELPYAGRYLEISAVYMQDDADWRSTGYFLLISDVTSQTVAKRLEAYDMIEQGQVLVQSFDQESLLKVRDLNQDVPLIQLLWYSPSEQDNATLTEWNNTTPGADTIRDEDFERIAEYAVGIGTNAIYQGQPVIDADFVHQAQKNGLSVHVYTINEQEDMKRVMALGVNGLFTDYPDRLLELVSD